MGLEVLCKGYASNQFDVFRWVSACLFQVFRALFPQKVVWP